MNVFSLVILVFLIAYLYLLITKKITVFPKPYYDFRKKVPVYIR